LAFFAGPAGSLLELEEANVVLLALFRETLPELLPSLARGSGVAGMI